MKSLALIAALGLAGCAPNLVWFGHSADRRHRLEVVEQGGEQWVRLDGEAQPAFEAVALEAMALSDRGRRLAYAAKSSEGWHVVIDGRPGRRHDGIGALVLSPDGDGIAYAAEDEGRWRLWRDGVAGEAFAAILDDSLRFSPDGAHLAYVARRDGEDHVVVDDHIGPGYDGIGRLHFGPTGRLAYVARRDERSRVVVDGHAERAYEGIGELVVGRHRHAYAAYRQGRWLVVVDGEERSAHRRVDELRLSSTDELAYVVTEEGGQQRVRVGDRWLGAHHHVPRGHLRWAPDGRSFWVGREAGGRARAYLDGEPGPAFDEIRGAAFATQGTRWGYVARQGRRWLVVIDGELSRGYDWADDLIFSEDGERHAYLARRDGRELLVHDRGRHALPKIVAGTLAFDEAGEHLGCVIGEPRSRRFFLAVDGRARRPFDLSELVARAAIDPASFGRQDEVMRRWVAAELARLDDAVPHPSAGRR